MTASVVLCEGYHDRAFWKGWLQYLGCTDPGAPSAGKTTRSQVLDPWGGTVTGGKYAFHTPTVNFLLVVPCRGRSNILPAARVHLSQRATQPIVRLVINVDVDQPASPSAPGIGGLNRQDVEHWTRQLDPAASLNNDGEIEIDGGTSKIALIRWEVDDPSSPGIPVSQSLERLVCAAIVSAYPARAQPLQAWLDSRPQPPQPSSKEFAWSFMAGWYAEHGCDDFYANLWRDPAVAAELELRLRASGAWQIAERLAR